MKHPTKNTHGCCDGSGQEHHVAGNDPNVGALSYVSLCLDPECVARREAAWARECGEEPALASPDRLRDAVDALRKIAEPRTDAERLWLSIIARDALRAMGIPLASEAGARCDSPAFPSSRVSIEGEDR